MDAVAAAGNDQVRPVVQQKRHVARGRDRHQHLAGALDRVVIDVLQAQLHRRDVAAVERRRQLIGESGGLETFGRHEVEPAGRRLSLGGHQSLPR